MTINQFLKSVGLEHLRDIFQREQVLAQIIIWEQSELQMCEGVAELTDATGGGRPQITCDIFLTHIF